MSKYTMIAKVVDSPKGKPISFCLISEDYKTVTVSAAELAKAIANKSVEVTNLDASLNSTNGAIDRYTTFLAPNMFVTGNAYAVILNRIEKNGVLAGYTVYDPRGQVIQIDVKQAVALANKGSISNGKIRHTQDGDIVSSINGVYPLVQMSVEKASTAKVSFRIMMFVRATKSGRKLDYVGVTAQCDSAVVLGKLGNKLTADYDKNYASLKALTGESEIDGIIACRMGVNKFYAVVGVSDFMNMLNGSKDLDVATGSKNLIVSHMDYDRDGEESVVFLSEGMNATTIQSAKVKSESEAGKQAVIRYGAGVIDYLSKMGAKFAK